MNYQPGLCIGDDGKPQRVTFRGFRGKVHPPFIFSPMVNGPAGLAFWQANFLSVCQYFHRSRWMSVEQYLHTVRREQIDRQKTKPWRMHYDKWDGVKVTILPRTDPDSLVVDSNVAVVMQAGHFANGQEAIRGAVVCRGKFDCDYFALARLIGHQATRELFSKQGREINP